MKATVYKVNRTKQEENYYNNVSRQHVVTNYNIKLRYSDSYTGTELEEILPIYKMKRGFKGWTPYQMARLVNKHIVIARFDRYYVFNMDGSIISLDGEDK